MSADGVADARPGRRVVAASMGLVLWGLITHSTYADSGDEPHYAMIVHSIVFDRDIDLANNYGDSRALVVLQLLLNIVVWQRPKLLWNGGTGASKLLVFLGGNNRWLAAWAPAMDPPWSRVTVVGVACASVGWLAWTAWLVRRTPDQPEVGPRVGAAMVPER